VARALWGFGRRLRRAGDETRQRETDFAWSRGDDWERERAAGFLHDEILSFLVVMTQQSDVATRASTLSAEAASTIGTVAQ
jgi:hypothetical protein